jgi:hypothetical protein
MDYQVDWNKEKQPRYELLRREYILEPMRDIEQDKCENEFPRKETGEAMRARVEKWFSGNIDEKDGSYGKNK